MAAVFTYLFAREMRCSVWGAFLAGAGFAFSGYLVSTVNLITTLSAVTWLPLAMLFYYRMIKDAPRFMNAVILGVIFTVMFLGGEPSVLYMIILLFGIGAVYFTMEEFLQRRAVNLYYVKAMLLALTVFAGLSAFQILPFWEFLKASSRESANYQMATIWNMPITDIPAIVIPFFHDIFKVFEGYWVRQSWLDNYYSGILIFFLFIIGALFDRSRKSRAILIFGLVGFAVALGKDTAIFELMYRFVPGFKVMRYSIRFFFIPAFAICILAGMGLDYYVSNSKTDTRLNRAVFIVLIMAFLSALAFFVLNFSDQQSLAWFKSLVTKLISRYNMPRTYTEDVFHNPLFLKFVSVEVMNLKRTFLIFALFGLVFYLGTKEDVRTAVIVGPFLVFFAVADVFQVNNGYNQLIDAKKFISPTANIAYLTRERDRLRALYADDINKQLFRICCSPKTAREHAYVPEREFAKGFEACKDRLINDQMMEFGIYDVNMYGSIYLKRNSKFMALVMDKKAQNLEKLLMLLNVRFVASSTQPRAAGFKLVNKSEAANIYEAQRYLERAFLVDKAVVMTDEDQILAKLKEGEFAPEKEVILEVEPVGTGSSENSCRVGTCPVLVSETVPTDTRSKVRIISYQPNRIVMRAEVLGKPKFLVLTDTYYPGWKVFVDGKAHKLLKADYIFRAVYLAPGSHDITFVYSPFFFKLGVVISVLTCLVVVLKMLVRRGVLW
jgi:hypothetical protein